ncbi:MAG: hypothetical protein LRY62_02150 [Alphaproteobacteria bacterium]|nr:hypothetical protein [Alphaproteobacteria bacterium]
MIHNSNPFLFKILEKIETIKKRYSYTPPPGTISAHLWFWCDRPVSDVEWKAFFKAHGSKVDLAVYSAVQPHYTAQPIFVGMADPVPERIGLC